jgi:hypothetical protein
MPPRQGGRKLASFHTMMTMCAVADDTAFGHFLERLRAFKPAPDSAIDDLLLGETESGANDISSDRRTATDVPRAKDHKKRGVAEEARPREGMRKSKSLPELASRPSPILRADGKAAARAWMQRNSVTFSSYHDVREFRPISSADSDTEDAEHPDTSASSERSPWVLLSRFSSTQDA